MALISCNNCGKQISDKRNNCIHCGNPIEIVSTIPITETIEKKEPSFLKKHLFLIFGIIFLFLIFLFIEDLLCDINIFCVVINPTAKIFYGSIILGVSLFIDYIRNRKRK